MLAVRITTSAAGAAMNYEMNADRAVLAQPQLRGLTSCRLDTLACEPLELEVPEADLYHWELGESVLLVVREEGPAIDLMIARR